MTRASVQRRVVSGRSVLSISGDLDLATAPGVADDLERLLAESSDGIVVDLSATTFLDSAGISLLYELRAGNRARGHDARLVVPEENLVRRTLILTGADRAFPMHGTVEDAVAAAAADRLA